MRARLSVFQALFDFDFFILVTIVTVITLVFHNFVALTAMVSGW
jgi:hypothetical protein